MSGATIIIGNEMIYFPEFDVWNDGFSMYPHIEL